MTEISFLIKLLMECKLNAATKKIVLERIGEVEAGLRPANQPRPIPPVTAQAPSMQALLEASPAPSVQNALAERQAIIQQAIAGKAIPGETGPRKMRGNVS